MDKHKENEYIAQSIAASSDTTKHMLTLKGINAASKLKDKQIPKPETMTVSELMANNENLLEQLPHIKTVNLELPEKYRPVKPLKGDMTCGLWYLQRMNIVLNEATVVAYYYTNSMAKLKKWVFKHHGVFFMANQYIVPAKIPHSKDCNTVEYRLTPALLKVGCSCPYCNSTNKNDAPVYLILESGKDPWQIGTRNSTALKEKITFHNGMFPTLAVTKSVHVDAWKKTWKINSDLNMVRACADFYTLYDLLLDFPDDTTIKELFNAHQKYLLQQFVAYTDMVVGGELRHSIHKIPYLSALDRAKQLKKISPVYTSIVNQIYKFGYSTKNTKDGRAVFWNKWYDIRQMYKNDALTVAHDLYQYFYKYWGNGYGGLTWAKSTKLLLDYNKGKLTDTIFIDSVWFLQHNGGVFLNKVWAHDALSDFAEGLHKVLEARQKDNIQHIINRTSEGVSRLWEEKRNGVKEPLSLKIVPNAGVGSVLFI